MEKEIKSLNKFMKRRILKSELLGYVKMMKSSENEFDYSSSDAEILRQSATEMRILCCELKERLEVKIKLS